MAKLKVLGDMIQITSDITEEQFNRIKTFAPEALITKDADTGEVLFGIEMGNASFSKYGICFCSTDANGKLFMTTNNPTVGDHSDKEKEEKKLLEVFAPVLAKLNDSEAHILRVLDTVSQMEDEVKSSIEFI